MSSELEKATSSLKDLYFVAQSNLQGINLFASLKNKTVEFFTNIDVPDELVFYSDGLKVMCYNVAKKQTMSFNNGLKSSVNLTVTNPKFPQSKRGATCVFSDDNILVFIANEMNNFWTITKNNEAKNYADSLFAGCEHDGNGIYKIYRIGIERSGKLSYLTCLLYDAKNNNFGAKHCGFVQLSIKPFNINETKFLFIKNDVAHYLALVSGEYRLVHINIKTGKVQTTKFDFDTTPVNVTYLHGKDVSYELYMKSTFDGDFTLQAKYLDVEQAKITFRNTKKINPFRIQGIYDFHSFFAIYYLDRYEYPKYYEKMLIYKIYTPRTDLFYG